MDWTKIALGAGAGFLVGGPGGALVGAGVVAFLGNKAPDNVKDLPGGTLLETIMPEEGVTNTVESPTGSGPYEVRAPPTPKPPVYPVSLKIGGPVYVDLPPVYPSLVDGAPTFAQPAESPVTVMSKPIGGGAHYILFPDPIGKETI
jgi:hypothetical protein